MDYRRSEVPKGCRVRGGGLADDDDSSPECWNVGGLHELSEMEEESREWQSATMAYDERHDNPAKIVADADSFRAMLSVDTLCDKEAALLGLVYSDCLSQIEAGRRVGAKSSWTSKLLLSAHRKVAAAIVARGPDRPF